MGRFLACIRVAYGSALVLAPGTLLRNLEPGATQSGAARTFARLLGARHLVEAAAVGPRRGARWALAGAAVDAAHSASMLALAAARPGRRRLATANALAAAFLAAAGLLEARRRSRSHASPTRHRSR